MIRNTGVTIVNRVGIGNVQDVAVTGEFACVIGYRDKFYVLDISIPNAPRVLGELSGLGRGRQLILSERIAYVTAREHGLYIIDWANPKAPRIISRYDTIELATGIAIKANILFVAQRQYGLEIMDVSDPRRPRYLSHIKTGEAQSVAVEGNYAYVGDWGTLELTIIDISNVRNPVIVAQEPMDGFGDGVFVQGDYAYASTGHHSRLRTKKKPGPEDPGYGKGHGMEVFNVANPNKPQHVSRVKFEESYQQSQDMWSVKVSNDHAFCADTWNGLYVVNVKEIEKPKIVGHLNFDDQEGQVYIGGLALTDDYIYAATSRDLFVIQAKSIAKGLKQKKTTPIVIPPKQEKRADNYRVYRNDGQIRSVDFIDDYTLVAAGAAGFKVLRLWPEIEEVNSYKSVGFVFDVARRGNLVYLAEAHGGMTIWRHQGNGAFGKIAEYKAENHHDQDREEEPVKQVLAPEGCDYALVHSGFHDFSVVDVSDPAKPREVLEKRLICLYGDQISHGLIHQRYCCAIGLKGLVWCDLLAKPPIFTSNVLGWGPGMDYFVGLVSYRDKMLLTINNGFKILDPSLADINESEFVEYDQPFPAAKARIYQDLLILSDRLRSKIAIFDLSKLKEPRLRQIVQTQGHPGGTVVYNDTLIVPNGNAGLYIYDKIFASPRRCGPDPGKRFPVSTSEENARTRTGKS